MIIYVELGAAWDSATYPIIDVSPGSNTFQVCT